MSRKMGGYSVVEVLVVVLVVGILAAIATVGINGMATKARDAKRKADAEVIALKIERFYKYNNTTILGHQYPRCQYLLDNVESIIGDSTLNDSIRCGGPYEASDEKYWYTPYNRNHEECLAVTPSAGVDPLTAAINGMCVSFQISYYEEATGQRKKVYSIWQN